MADCAHRSLPGAELVRCLRHGDASAGVTVWAWATGSSSAGCACELADRFVVAAEPVTPRWWGSVDVVLARRRASVSAALRVSLPTGCGLIAVPVPGGTVFRTTDEVALFGAERAGVCGVCVYPWLVSERNPAVPAGSRRQRASRGR